MRRYLTIIAITVMLLATAALGTASAATTAATFKPKGCHWEWTSLFSGKYYGCYCPSGWHVAYPPWWSFFNREPFCARNKKK